MQGLLLGAPAAASLVMLLLLPGCGRAELLVASPGDLPRKLAAATPGDTIKLEPGEYRNFRIAGRDFRPGLTIDAEGATITGATLARSQGVTIRGGSFRLEPSPPGEKNFRAAVLMRDVRDVKILGGRFSGPGALQGAMRQEFGDGYGVRIVGGQGVEVSDGSFDGFKVGVAMTRIDGFRLIGNTFTGMRADGITVSLSRNGLIEKNNCDSTRVRDKEHPDCIQMWSRPTAPPSADVVIRANNIKGSTQGIGLHNHIRDGADDGGYDRILIEENVISVSRANAISLKNARDSIVRNNRVTTAPGSQFRASIRVSGPSVTVCGNTVGAGAGKPGVTDPAC